MHIKPRPDDRNVPTQHIAALLGATCCVRVAMCSDMFGVVGSSLKLVKFEPTTPNMLQHVATGWPNARSMLRPTIAMLQYVALAWCDPLAGALPEETKFLFSHKPVFEARACYFIRLKY